MGIKFRENVEEPWVWAGEWFDRLSNLAEALESFKQVNPNGLKRAFLVVPSRSLVANAIAWGYSKFAFQNPAPELISRPISDLGQLAAGQKIQVLFPVMSGQTQKQIRVGTFVSFQTAKPVSKLELSQDGRSQTYGIRPSVTFSVVPQYTPDGDYWESLASQDEKATVLNRFNSQQNPMSMIFTELGAYQDELAFEFHETSLNPTLGIDSLSLEQAIRVDRYSDDQHSHFVNGWDYFGHFDSIRADMGERLFAYRTIILDGNQALEALAQRDEFRNSFVLGIFESGRNLLQERGVSAFLGEASYYEAIPDFESQLGWNAPDGVRIWGWE